MLFRSIALPVVLIALLSACAAPATPTPAPTVAPTAAPQPGATATRAPLPPSAAGTLRVVVLPITDVVPFYIAQAQGYFKAQGINVELVPVASAAERDQMLVTQQADVQLTDLVGPLLLNSQSPRLKIVRTARTPFPNNPQFWILAPKDGAVKTAADLKGKEVAISQNSVIAYLTQRMLEKEGLAPAEIKTTNIPAIPTRLQLLQQNQIAAAMLPDPLASLAIMQGARVIVDDTKYPEYSQSVIAFRADLVANRADDVRKFLAAYDKAIADIRAKPDQFRNTLIEVGRVPDQLKDKYQFPPFPDPRIPTKAQWDDVVKWAMDNKLITAPVSYESSVDAGFVK
jgi:NitT/TauT family transport system substrate-binding protein